VPSTFYICKTRGIAVGPAHELLINNPLESRVPVAPALAEWASRPLVGNRTLRGLGFSSLGLGPLEGRAYLVTGKGSGHLMPTVVATVMRCGHAISGVAAAHVVGDVGRRT
jgi:hypothetical protein